MSADNVKLVEGAYAAFGRGDVPAILALLTDDVSWEHPQQRTIPWGGVRTGHDGAASFFGALVGTVEPLAFEPREFVSAGAHVVVFGSERMRVRANGAEYEVSWAHDFTFRDGKIARFRELTDTAAVVAALRA